MDSQEKPSNSQNNNNKNKIKSNIKILQWNCRSIVNKINALKSIADEYDIILLSETWLLKDKKSTLKTLT